MEQSPRYLSAQEGTINCNYSEGMITLQWLQQNPGGGIISLLILSLEVKRKGRVSATINKRERYSSLHITASQATKQTLPSTSVLWRHRALQASGTCTQTLKLKGIISSHPCLSIFICLSHQTDETPLTN